MNKTTFLGEYTMALTPVTPIDTLKKENDDASLSGVSKPRSRSKTLTITLPVELYERLEDFKFNERKKSVSGILADAAREYLENYRK